ncbi:MAG TPA: hypothetical protein ENK23_07935, partial [Sorangium sp.]|nr:hypothetical protein [Sorangium sp.]
MGPTWAVSGEAGWQRWRCLAAIAFATGMLHCHGASEDASSSGGGGRAQGGAPSTGAGGHAGVCEGSGFVVDPVALVGCDSNGPGNEDCHYRVVTDASKCCAEKPCDRLVVHWAGGEQGCKAGKYDEPVLQQYASRGFVAVCAQPFTTADEAGRYPYVAEF